VLARAKILQMMVLLEVKLPQAVILRQAEVLQVSDLLEVISAQQLVVRVLLSVPHPQESARAPVVPR